MKTKRKVKLMKCMHKTENSSSDSDQDQNDSSIVLIQASEIPKLKKMFASAILKPNQEEGNQSDYIRISQ